MENNIDVKQRTLFFKHIKTRHITDKFFILLLPLILLFWLGIGIYDIVDKRIFITFVTYMKWPCGEFLIYGVTTVLVIILLLVILNKFKNDWLVYMISIFIFIIILIQITCSLGQLFFLAKIGFDWTLFTFFILGIVLIYYNVTIFICTRELGVVTLGPMVKEPIRAIVHSFPVLIISLVVIFLSAIIFTFTEIFLFNAIWQHLYHTKEVESWSEFWYCFCIFPYAFAGIYIFNFIWNFGFTATADYFANCCNGQRISCIRIFRSFKTTARYHLGTVSFLSIPILPSIYALTMVFKYNNKPPGKQSDYKLINFISKISLILNISEYASIHTSIYGSKTLKSMRQMVDLRHSNPLVFLTLNAVPLKIVDLIMTMTMIVGWFASSFAELNIFEDFLSSSYDDPAIDTHVSLYLALTYFVYSMIALLVRPAACTFTIYKMIRDQRESEISGEHNEFIEH